MATNDIKHTVFTVNGANRLTLDGVKSVESFEPDFLTLELSDGGLSVEGEGMKIESLSQKGGEMVIVGKINGVFYTKVKKKKGFFEGILG